MSTYAKKPREFEAKKWDGTIKSANEMVEWLGNKEEPTILLGGSEPILKLGRYTVWPDYVVLKDRHGAIAFVIDEGTLEREFWMVAQ